MKQVYVITLLVISSLLIFGCKSGDDTANETCIGNPGVGESTTPNMLLIILDDVGIDAFPGYDIGDVKPTTPNMDQLAASGITFDNVWVNPVCSPTRATIITGKYGYHTNVLNPSNLGTLSTDETSIQQYMDQNLSTPYDHAVIGKWHLGGDPRDFGMDYYAGSLSGGVPDYSSWNFTVDGNSSNSSEYVSSVYTQEAIDWINGRAANQPWFCWLAYNAAHTPFHLPPTEMHSQGNLPSDQASIDANPLPYYMAMIESIDYQIGEIKNAMSVEDFENTVIIVLGDNGTPGQVAQSPFTSNRSKGSMFQGGVNVPMIIAGKNVIRQSVREDALINSTDLFTTFLNIAGSDITEIHNSQSFAHLLTASSEDTREYIYAEVTMDNTSGYTIRNDQYKLIVNDSTNNRFYDLFADPYESTNLFMGGLNDEEQVARAALIAAAEAIRQ